MKGDIIPNNEFLFKYIKPDALPKDQEDIPFSIFIDEELSCDWEKYQKYPEKSFHIIEGKNLIIKILVCDEIRHPCNPKRPQVLQPAWEQKIVHDPIRKGEDLMHPTIENVAHSLINGKKKIHITTAIAKNSKIYKLIDPLSIVNEFALRRDKIFSYRKLIILIIFIIALFILAKLCLEIYL